MNMTKEINVDATYRHIGTVLEEIMKTDLTLRKAAARALDEKTNRMSRLLKIKDAAQIAGVSLATLHRAMNDGRLGYVCPTGKSRRIPEHCLSAWLNGETNPEQNQPTQERKIENEKE